MPIRFSDVTLYSIKELSDILGISSNTLRVYFRQGKLKGRKIARSWYVSEEELKRYLKVNGIKKENIIDNTI